MSTDPAGLIAALGLGEEDRAAWEGSGLARDAFAEWVTDRVARRPAGARARAVYGAQECHAFARAALLEALALGRGDRLLEIGCGGGVLLREALATGAEVCGVDHSEEMVALARQVAGAEVVLASAEALPFDDGRFSAVAMSMVFLFFEAPETVLSECRRVLAAHGRVAIYTPGPELRGTPAAPELIASRSHFYTDEQLAAMAQAAGFGRVRVANDGGAQLMTARA